jgi:hypothetical protein
VKRGSNVYIYRRSNVVCTALDIINWFGMAKGVMDVCS